LNIKKLNKMLNLLSNNRLSKRRKHRRSTVPQISSQPQRLGVGYTLARITRNVPIAKGNTVYDIMSNCFASYEYTRQATDFSFARLKNITVIQHPMSAPLPAHNNFNTIAYLYMDWTDGSSENIITIDNAKLMCLNLTRPKIYTFLPPNARLRYDESESEIVAQSLPINYREWFDARSYVAKNAPGWLKFSNNSDVGFHTTVDIVMEFKGAKGLDSINMNDVNKFIKVSLPPAPEVKIGEEDFEEFEEDDKEEKIERKKEKKKEKKERIKEYEDKAKSIK